MKKLSLYIFLGLLLVGFSTSAYSYNLYKVGSITGRVWNDYGDYFIDKDIEISVGSNGTEATVRFNYEMGIGEIDIDYEFIIKGNEIVIENNPSFNKLLAIIKKAIKWTKIAKENEADTTKSLGKDFCGRSDGWYNTYCYASFFSHNGGKQTDLIINISGGEYGAKKEKYYIDDINQKHLLKLLLEEIHNKIAHSIEQNKKSSDLFD